MKKILEIKVTHESPFQTNSLNNFLDKTHEDPAGCQETSPKNNISAQDIKEICKTLFEIEMEKLPKIDYSDISSLNTRVKLLEDLILKKKEKNVEEFMNWTKKNEDLKKSLLKMKKETNADKQTLTRIYEKRILELRKEENSIRSETFEVKQRVYKLELENSAAEKELQDLEQEIWDILSYRKSCQAELEGRNVILPGLIEEISQENRKLAQSNQSNLAYLSSLFSRND